MRIYKNQVMVDKDKKKHHDENHKDEKVEECPFC